MFIDVQSYLEGLEETVAQDRKDLLDLVRFDDFVAALNSYVQDHGYAGRLTTPLFEIRSIASDAAAILTTDMPEERAAVELLGRKRNLLRSPQQYLKETLRGLVSQATSAVTTYGDEVAETIKPSSTEEDAPDQHEQTQKRAQERCAKLEQDVKSATEAEQRSLMQELTMFHEGGFARQLRSQVETALLHERGSDRNTEGFQVEWIAPSGTTPSEWSARLQKAGKVAQTIGKEAEFWTSYEHFSRDFYDGELEAIDEALNGLVGERQTRNEMTEALNQIVSEAQTLIQRIQAGVVAET